MEYEAEKNALLNLVKDTESFARLSQLVNKPNIFDILKISRMEIRHSNMLAWLLDPNENHGLGDSFIREFISHASTNIDTGTALRILTGNLNTFKIYREWNNIDILLVSSELSTVVAIENKVGAKEHNAGGTQEKQTLAYKKSIEDHYRDYCKLFVYLTPEGDDPSDEVWIVVTYADIIQTLKQIYQDKADSLLPEISVLIKNYIEAINKNIIMDKELVDLCNEIYNRHKKALDLIYENKYDINTQISDLCKDVLREFKDKGVELDQSSKKTYIRFRTTILKQYFNEFIEEGRYYYQFEIRGQMKVMLEFYKDYEVDECIIEKINSYSGKFKNHRKVTAENWNRWKRVWTRSLKIEEYDEEEIKKSIKEQINKILDVEKLIDNIKQQ